MKSSNIRKILFITLSNIGDVILTLPVFSALKDNFPDAAIDIVIGPRPEQIFKKDPRVNRVFVYDKHAGFKDKMRLVARLRAERYDLAVDMKTSLLPILIAAKHKAFFPRVKSQVKHKRLVHLETLRPFGINYREQKNIYIDDESRNRIDMLLEHSNVKDTDVIIGVSPGSRSRLKQWKKEAFVDVINSIIKDPRHKVILIGDLNDVVLSKEIASMVNPAGSLIDLTGKTSLNELFALIQKFNLLLTCDSASMHIASDLGIKIVALFGPTDPEEYGPRGDKDIVIRKNLKCSPCKKARCRFGTHECMHSIHSQEVLAAIEKII